MRRIAVLCLIVACGKSPGGNNNGPDANVFGDGPPLSGDKYSLTWGPVSVDPGVEDTQCIWLKLGNDAEIKVHQLHDVLSASSHHLIVYKDDMDTTEQLTPTPCQPFTGALNTTGKISPIVITQKHDDEVTLPDGVAYTFAPHQMVKLEMHYINASDSAQMAQATVDIFAADPATIHDEAALLFTGSPDIGGSQGQGIAPGASYTLHEFFTAPTYTGFDPTTMKIFAITGHEHKLGTGVQAQVGPNSSGPFQNVYDPMPFQWAEPATANFPTPLQIPAGGGIDMTCSWTNTTASTVKFGESATDEMCFFWMYYYPSQGSKVCIHTERLTSNGLNICCPGDSLCSQVGF